MPQPKKYPIKSAAQRKKSRNRQLVNARKQRKVEQSLINCPEISEELYCLTQNHLPFIKQEYLQSYKNVISDSNYLQLKEHGQLSDVLPEYDSYKINTIVNKNSGTSVSEMIRDNQTNSRITENVASLDSVVCHGGTRNVCDTQTDCQPTLQNEDCVVESDKIFSVSDKNADLHTVDVTDRLQSNVLIQTQHDHLLTQKRAHNEEKHYKCDLCGAGFNVYCYLKTHIKTHIQDTPYKCDVCVARFAYKRYLVRHKRIHKPTVGKRYMCDVCGAGFTVCTNLKYHKRIHTGEKPYMCDVCGVRFACKKYLVTHERIHTGEKPYICVICGARFTLNSSLKNHKRIHTGEKPYKCDVCETRFAYRVNLVAHKRFHTGEKPHNCDVCDSSFSTRAHLVRHKRFHTGDKPYKCNVCSASFTQRGNLKIHTRTHTGEKPYKCDVCDTGFAYKSSLVKHQRIHSEVTP